MKWAISKDLPFVRNATEPALAKLLRIGFFKNIKYENIKYKKFGRKIIPVMIFRNLLKTSFSILLLSLGKGCRYLTG